MGSVRSFLGSHLPISADRHESRNSNSAGLTWSPLEQPTKGDRRPWLLPHNVQDISDKSMVQSGGKRQTVNGVTHLEMRQKEKNKVGGAESTTGVGE